MMEESIEKIISKDQDYKMTNSKENNVYCRSSKFSIFLLFKFDPVSYKNYNRYNFSKILSRSDFVLPKEGKQERISKYK